MEPKFNNYSKELEKEAMDFFKERGKVQFEVLGKKIIGGRMACKAICRVPSVDTIFDPHQKEHINIAFITGYNKAPLDSNKTAVPLFGNIYFYGAEGGYMQLSYDNAMDRKLFLYLYFCRWNKSNIIETAKGGQIKQAWHEKPSQYLFFMNDPEAEAEKLNKMDALVSQAKHLIHSELSSTDVIRLYNARYPNKSGQEGLNTIKRSLAILAGQEPEYIINASKNERVELMNLIKNCEKEAYLFYKSADATWRWKDTGEVVVKVKEKQDRYEVLFRAAKVETDIQAMMKTFLKTAEEEKRATMQNKSTKQPANAS